MDVVEDGQKLTKQQELVNNRYVFFSNISPISSDDTKLFRKKINIMLDILNNLKTRWGICSNTQFIIILIVFAITGSLALYLSQPILNILNIHDKINNPLLYYSLRLIIIFPIYQIVLIIVGTLFGQFNFFWNLEKQTIQRLLKIFMKKNRPN
jgi:hypothetical protein